MFYAAGIEIMMPDQIRDIKTEADSIFYSENEVIDFATYLLKWEGYLPENMSMCLAIWKKYPYEPPIEKGDRPRRQRPYGYRQASTAVPEKQRPGDARRRREGEPRDAREGGRVQQADGLQRLPAERADARDGAVRRRGTS